MTAMTTEPGSVVGILISRLLNRFPLLSRCISGLWLAGPRIGEVASLTHLAAATVTGLPMEAWP